jgi:hypothetical protein
LLAHLGQIAPSLELGLLLEFTAMQAPRRAQAAGARTVLPEVKLVSEELIAEVTGAGLELVVWDFMAAEHAPLLADPRVTGVITDDVPGALSARASL